MNLFKSPLGSIVSGISGIMLGIVAMWMVYQPLTLSNIKEVNKLHRDILVRDLSLAKLQLIIDTSIPELEDRINIITEVHNRKNDILDKLEVNLPYSFLEKRMLAAKANKVENVAMGEGNKLKKKTKKKVTNKRRSKKTSSKKTKKKVTNKRKSKKRKK